MGFSLTSDSSAQQFGAIRSASSPITAQVNRAGVQDSQQGSDRPAVSPTIQEPLRPDEQPAGQDAGLDKSENRQRPDFGPWPAKKINDIRVDIRETGARFPEDRSSQLIGFSSQQWTEFTPTPKVFSWAAPDIRYQPLYFEDVALERYGQTLPPFRQTVKSGWHMTKSFFLAPNNICHDPIFSCDYPLGFCRPGDKIDYTLQRHYLGHENER